MTLTAPDPREIQEFQFRLLSRLRIFHEDSPLPSDPLSLVTAATKYGLVIVSHPRGLSVIQIQKIVDLHGHEKKKPAEVADVLEFPSRIIQMPAQPTHLEVSCDNQYLAACYVDNSAHVIKIFEITSFLSEQVSEACEVRPTAKISSLAWNPTINTMLAVCMLDGSVAVYEFKNNVISINSVPAEAKATCLCWSPKGKQIVVGSANGTLSQFKPELKIVKSIPAPPSDNSLSVVSVQWLSNFQFAAVYKDSSITDRPVTALYIVNTPKGGEVTYINYDDICFSTSAVRSPQYFMIHQLNWNVLLVASSTSMELGVLGLQNDNWEQWIQEDQFRAELPLSAEEKDETFPLGMVLDTSVQYNIPLGENQSLPPMPLLILLSDEGLLSLFFVVNMLPSATSICSPPEQLPDLSGLHRFIYHTTVNNSTNQTAQPSQELVSKPVATTTASQTQPLGQTQGVAKAEPSFLGTSQSQTSPIPNWTATANPKLSFTPSVSQPTSVRGFPTATSAPAFSTVSTSLFETGSKSTQSFTLPGSQVTITPIASSASIISQSSVSATTPMAPMYSISSSTPQPQLQAASKPKVNLIPAEVKKPEPVVSQLASNVSLSKPGELNEDPKDTLSDAVVIAAINEEVAIFTAELEELKQQHRSINIHIGPEDEKEQLQQQLHDLEAFFKELKETTTAQKTEVHLLKNSLLDSFNWVEDAKSRHEQYSNPYFMRLVKSQDLDPVISRKMASIDHLMYYIESQIVQVNKHLDSLWCDTQNKGLKNKMQVPSLDTVYQALVMMNNIIHQQRLIMEDIEQRLKTLNRKRTNKISLSDVTLSHSKDSTSNELSKLAENFLKIKCGSQESADEYSIIDVAQETLSERKLLALQEAFAQRKVVHIVPTEYKICRSRITDSSSILSMISSLPASGVKPGGISAGQPIVTFNTTSESTQGKSKPLKSSETVAIENDKISQPGSQVLGDVKSNLISTLNTNSETPLKSAPIAGQRILQTNLFGNKENKPSSANIATTSAQVSLSQSQSKMFSFKSSDKNLNKESTFGSIDKKENLSQNQMEPNSSVASSTQFSFKLSSNNQVTSSAPADSFVQSKSPLSSLTNMVAGYGETLAKVSSEKPTSLPKISTNQSFTVSDTNKHVLSRASTTSVTQSSNVPSTDTVTKNLFGGVISSQKKPNDTSPSTPLLGADNVPNRNIFGGDNTSKSIFSGNSGAATTKSIFGVDTENSAATTKSIFGVDNGNSAATNKSIFGVDAGNTAANTKSIFGVDPAQHKSIFGVDLTATKTYSGSDSTSSTLATNAPVIGKNSSETDLIKPKNIFGGEVGTTKINFGSGTVSSDITSKNASLLQNISGSNLDLTKHSSNIESKMSQPVTGSKVPVEVITTSSVQNASSANKNIPAESKSGLPKTVSSNISSSTKSIFGAEPRILQTEPTEEGRVSSTETATNMGSLQVESSSNLFGNLNLGSPTSTAPQKAETSIFGGSSSTFVASNIETVSAETTSLPKAVEEPSNPSVFGSVAPTTTVPSSSTFGTSLFGSQSKAETLPTVVTSPTKTEVTSLSFGQLSVSPTESNTTPVTIKTDTSAFSFSLPQSTTAATSTFSFAQAATSVPSSTSDDKNTKLNLTFGQPSATTANSIFGGFNTQPATSSSTSIFGAPASTVSQTSFTFALPTATTAQTSFFGNKSNVFGSAPATTTNSFFGQSSPATTSSVFGQPTGSTPVFGQAVSSPAISPFGSSSGFGAKPTFGQSGGSLFGQSASGGFGTSGGTSVFGGGASMFGGGATGGSGGGLFQSSGTGSIFGGGSTSPGGSFSSGGQSVSQSGFGSPPAFQQNKLGGFGTASTFGASQPAFGAAPTFGGSPAFGSPPKVFGSSPSAGFGAPTQQPTGFESLANQNTMTFGNLAQNQTGGFSSGSVFGGTTQPPPQQQTGFSSPPSNFSGSSFSSWR